MAATHALPDYRHAEPPQPRTNPTKRYIIYRFLFDKHQSGTTILHFSLLARWFCALVIGVRKRAYRDTKRTQRNIWQGTPTIHFRINFELRQQLCFNGTSACVRRKHNTNDRTNHVGSLPSACPTVLIMSGKGLGQSAFRACGYHKM
eukprot:3688209-Amphidinium_carterae.1